MPTVGSYACLASLILCAALALVPAPAFATDMDDSAVQLRRLQALIDNDNKDVPATLLESRACAVRVLSGVLLYRRDPDRYRNALFAELVIDDYAERSAGTYNEIGTDEAASAMDAASVAPEGITDQRVRMVIGFCALKGRNLWMKARDGSRLSLARFFRGAALASLLKGTDEDTVAITSAIDAHTASRHASPTP